ncbi:hypothetical protein Hanom_Chr10g00964911 [Helianthus anomalus]
MGIGFGPSPTGAAPPAISPPSSGVLLVALRPFEPVLPLSHTPIHTTYIYTY